MNHLEKGLRSLSLRILYLHLSRSSKISSLSTKRCRINRKVISKKNASRHTHSNEVKMSCAHQDTKVGCRQHGVEMRGKADTVAETPLPSHSRQWPTLGDPSTTITYKRGSSFSWLRRQLSGRAATDLSTSLHRRASSTFYISSTAPASPGAWSHSSPEDWSNQELQRATGRRGTLRLWLFAR